MQTSISKILGILFVIGLSIPALLLVRDRIAERTEHPIEPEIAGLFDQWNRSDSPGAAVIAIRDGETVFRRGFGAADPENNTRIAPGTTLFSLASVSKQFTAFAVLLLAEDGLLDLDADVSEYLPWFPDFGSPITPRHLLHHTSGLREDTMLASLEGEAFLPEDPYLQRDSVAMLARQRELSFPTGTAINYCNSNYIVLAEVVAAVSGQSFRDFMAEAIFRPLGMESSRIVRVEDAQETLGYIGEEPSRGLVTWGENGVIATIDDLAIWARHLLNPTYRPEATRQLFERGRLEDGTELIYAGGLEYGSIRGVETVGHGGSLPGLGHMAELILVPSHGLAVVMLGNARQALARAPEVVEALLFGEPELAPATVATATAAPALGQDLEPWAGRYLSSFDAFDLAIEGGKLFYRAGIRNMKVEPAADGRIYLPIFRQHATAAFEGEKVRSLQLKRGLEHVEYQRVEPADPTSLAQGEHEGLFRAVELDVEIRVNTHEGGLRIEGEGLLAQEWEPVSTDTFRTDYRDMLIRFDRDTNGTVTQMRLDMSRIRNLRFARSPSEP